MNHKLRLLAVDLLRTVLILVVAAMLGAAFFYTFPAFLDVRAGRVAFSKVLGPFGLGFGALLVAVAVVLVIQRLNGVIYRERQAIRARRYRSQAPSVSAAGAPTQTKTRPAIPTVQPAYPAYWPELRQLVLERDGYRCGNCGSKEGLHVHHIVPLSLGGTNEMGNLRTLCKNCHARLHPHMKDSH